MHLETKSFVDYLGFESVRERNMHVYQIGETLFYSERKISLEACKERGVANFPDHNGEECIGEYCSFCVSVWDDKLEQWDDEFVLTAEYANCYDLETGERAWSELWEADEPDGETCIEDLPNWYDMTEYQLFQRNRR